MFLLLNTYFAMHIFCCYCSDAIVGSMWRRCRHLKNYRRTFPQQQKQHQLVTWLRVSANVQMIPQLSRQCLLSFFEKTERRQEGNQKNLNNLNAIVPVCVCLCLLTYLMCNKFIKWFATILRRLCISLLFVICLLLASVRLPTQKPAKSHHSFLYKAVNIHPWQF